MNVPIARLFGVIVVLFTLLVVWTSRWTVFQAGALNNDVLNRRTLIDELKIKRGRIIADDGTVLARSVPAVGGTYYALLSHQQPVRARGRVLDRRPGTQCRTGALPRRRAARCPDGSELDLRAADAAAGG